MGRWEPGSQARLHAAATELFVEQGYAATTVPQIAQRAGLTTRSFFRYFADKREVLFAGEGTLPDFVAEVIASADAKLDVLAVIRYATTGVLGAHLEPLRAELELITRIIGTDSGLQERYLRKTAILQDAATAGFARRGLDPLSSSVAGGLATMVYEAALEEWLRKEGKTFSEIAESVVNAVEAMLNR